MALNEETPWIPKVGDTVCNCFFEHLKVKSVDLEEGDAVLEDDRLYSINACLDPFPHPGYVHPEPAPRASVTAGSENRHG